MIKKIIKIEGMHCQNCAARVEKALNNVEGLSAKVHLADKTAEIESESEIDEVVLKNIIESAGYKVL